MINTNIYLKKTIGTFVLAMFIASLFLVSAGFAGADFIVRKNNAVLQGVVTEVSPGHLEIKIDDVGSTIQPVFPPSQPGYGEDNPSGWQQVDISIDVGNNVIYKNGQPNKGDVVKVRARELSGREYYDYSAKRIEVLTNGYGERIKARVNIGSIASINCNSGELIVQFSEFYSANYDIRNNNRTNFFRKNGNEINCEKFAKNAEGKRVRVNGVQNKNGVFKANKVQFLGGRGY